MDWHLETRRLVSNISPHHDTFADRVKSGDVIAVLLGCTNPLVLRPVSQSSAYQVVGECFTYGLGDSNALLGPLPSPWMVHASYTSRGRDAYTFFNKETGESTKEDPRLVDLRSSTPWERIERTPDGDDPIHYDFFSDKVTGEVINYDPRLEPHALNERGVSLSTFALV